MQPCCVLLHSCKQSLGYLAPLRNLAPGTALACSYGFSKDVIDDRHCLLPCWESALQDITIVHPHQVPLTAQVCHHLHKSHEDD